MSPLALPDDVARTLADVGLRPTGAFGPSGGWLAADPAGILLELVVRAGASDEPVAGALTSLRLDHLVPVRAVLPMPGGRCGLLVVPGPSLSLAGVRRARVPLTDGEVATVAIPLARTLDALHAAGLAYGPLDIGQVLLTADGMPVLAPPSRPFGAADDDLPELLTALIGTMAPRTVALSTWGRDDWQAGRGLREVLEDLLAAGCRSGEEAARACLDTVRPEPVRIPAEALAAAAPARTLVAEPPPAGLAPAFRRPGPAVRASRVPARRIAVASSARLARLRPQAPEEPTARSVASPGRAVARRAARRRRRLGGGLLVALVLGVAVVLLLRPAGAAEAGTAGTGAPPVGATPAASDRAALGGAPPAAGAGGTVTATAGTTAVPADPVRDRDDPAGAAAALTRLRASALVTGGAAALDAVDVAGGPAREDDGRLLASLGGGRIEGLAADVQDVRLVEPDLGGQEVTVQVTAAMSPYTLVARDGSRGSVPGTTPRAAALTLRWTDDGWRVWRVSSPTRP